MYFDSSGNSSGSFGIEHDNGFSKKGGSGTARPICFIPFLNLFGKIGIQDK